MARKENYVVSNMNVESVLCMKGGKGEDSYDNNSKMQEQHARSVLHLLMEALDGVGLSSVAAGAFVVADLGCSSGRNAINTMEFMINHLTEHYTVAAEEPPEFSAFFCDLPSNDFNTLFQLLPPSDGSSGSYFTAGVAGSFYRRLFPAKSVDFFYSAFSLHWLSQIPKEVMEKGSAAYNEGRVTINGAKESTVNAYKKQFQSDLGVFLRSRSKELKPGGSMFLMLLGRTSPDPADQGAWILTFSTRYQDAWNDLVQEGLISSEKRDTFNIPIYTPSLEEFKEVVERDGAFIINKLQLFHGGSALIIDDPNDAVEISRAYVSLCRSLTGGLVDAHIGDQLGHELFSRLLSQAVDQAKELMDQFQLVHIVASLTLA
uniref:Cinnamate/p-coumarate carboxyl methyltransferase 1 n=1 Tax=Ocimum basilicum TaxID=39350 RepID=A9UCA3_OCIBA|nr:cinnamate/p-coumarate carboxyl methyltransferase 1 [Ocimum basilicum]